MICPTCQRRLANNAKCCPTCQHDFEADRAEKTRLQLFSAAVLLLLLAGALFVVLLPGIIINALRGRYRGGSRGVISSAIRDWQTWAISIPLVLVGLMFLGESDSLSNGRDRSGAPDSSPVAAFDFSPSPSGTVTDSGVEVRRAIPVHGVPVSPDAFYKVSGVGLGDTLNVRTGPGADNALVVRLPNGAKDILVTGAAVMNGSTEWVPVRCGDRNGWVASQYLRLQ